MVWSFGIEKKKEKKKQAKDGISRNGNAMEGEGRNANDESTNENKLMTEINLFYFIIFFIIIY